MKGENYQLWLLKVLDKKKALQLIMDLDELLQITLGYKQPPEDQENQQPDEQARTEQELPKDKMLQFLDEASGKCEPVSTGVGITGAQTGIGIGMLNQDGCCMQVDMKATDTFVEINKECMSFDDKFD